MSTPDDVTLPAPFVQSELVTIREAAERLGCHERTIRRHIKAGTLAAIPDRGRLLVQLAGVSDLSEARQNTARPRTAVTPPAADTARSYDAAHAREVELLEARIRDLQDTIETYKRMLPAPTPAGRVQWREIVFWIVVLTILAMAAYMVAVVTAPDPATIYRLAYPAR